MTYKEALELKKVKECLIGSIAENGFNIDKILIVPTKDASRNAFLNSYLVNGNEEISISPYVNESLEVWAIDAKHLKEANILFYKKLT